MPEAQEILCRQHAEDHLSIGVSGYKIDKVDGYDHWLWPEHATFPSGTPGETMRQVYGDVRQVIRLRLRLLPYLYTAFANYNRFGIPPLRAMVLEQGSPDAPAKTGSAELDDVTNPYAQVSEPEQIEVSTPGRIPLFVKDGAVIPLLTKHVDNTSQAYGHPLQVRHYGEQPGWFELYEDDGISFDYETGAFALRRFSFADGRGAEAILRPGPKMFGTVERWVEMTDNRETVE